MRTDIHRPSVIKPEDYEFVGLENIKIEAFGDCFFAVAERENIRRHMASTGGRYSSHEHGGTCGVCGAAAVWTVLFYHQPTNTYVRTGQDCAEKMGLDYDRDGMTVFKRSAATAEKNRAGRAKAKLMLGKHGLGKAFELFLETEAAIKARTDFAIRCNVEAQERFKAGVISDTTPWFRRADCPPDPSKDRLTLADMVRKMVTWGDDWSEKQVAFGRTLVSRIEREAAIAAEREAERAAAAPVPVTDKRIPIEGDVLSTKVVETDFGYVTKVLVRAADGWKVYGSAPVKGVDLKHGDRVRFMARVAVSDDDPKFGFFSRPTQGEVLS